MLEKIGLPAKPSMRGGAWVVDASHCQGCSSQFTFINRKHHCRRCGGLFCNSCTLQRMILRGQGDSPVRICDPCKKLEDAARFELRYGHKSRSVKETEGKQQFLSRREPQSDGVSDLQRAASSASSSDFASEAVTPEGKDVLRSTTAELHDNTLKEMGSKSPEELRLQAAAEKKKYRILKAEGKPEVALQAFKRGKDLERQAEALEIALRKNRRKAAILHNSASSQIKNDAHEGSLGKKNIASQSSGLVKDDLLSELRELGWSDVDLHDAEKKPEKLSLEGELSNIIKEIPSKSNVARGSSGIDNSQVLAHKKKALLLKREGKLAEAKEELKKAKILEKQLEEQELLGQADDSDDELSALIRGMDDEQDEPFADDGHDLHVKFDHLSRLDDRVIDDNFDVTDDDMNDPEIAAALRSFGWSEQDDHVEEEGSQSVPSREALESQVLTLKREALNKKRAGNTAEAMALLKKAKLLEKDLDTAQTESSPPQKKLTQQMSGQASMPEADDEIVTEVKDPGQSKPKGKFLIQRELLGLKKKALALRREGRTDEADEELRKGKELERQLQEMENTPKPMSTKADGVKKDQEHASLHQDISGDLSLDMEGAAAVVTEEDMADPAMLSALKNLGWVDEHVESANNPRVSSKQTNNASAQETGPSRVMTKVPRNKTEIQRELLGIKRKALALRRQGKTREAEDELEKAKSLEKEVAEMESQQLPEPLEIKTDVFSDLTSKEKPEALIPVDDSEVIKTSSIKGTISKDEVSAKDIHDVDLKNGFATSVPPATLSDGLTIRSHKLESSSTAIVDSQEKSSDQMDSLTGNDGNSQASILKLTNRLSRLPTIPSVEHAIAGQQSDARGNTKGDQGESARALNAYTVDKRQTENATMEQDPNKEANTAQGSESLNDQILTRKRKAVALKREGKMAEAREELRQAKLLEKSLEEGKHHVSEASQNIFVSMSASSSAVSDSKHQKPMSGRDRLKLQQESLAHKRQALKLRREGRIEESDVELEHAKALEAQLEELDSQNSNNKKGAVDDVVVEDLLDPQLLSALKSIGWGESDMAIHPQEKSASKSISKNINSSSQEKPEAKSNIPKTTNTSFEKATLEEQINAEKLRAVNLKRAGKQAEALEALRAAKRLEKRLLSLA